LTYSITAPVKIDFFAAEQTPLYITIAAFLQGCPFHEKKVDEKRAMQMLFDTGYLADLLDESLMVSRLG